MASHREQIAANLAFDDTLQTASIFSEMQSTIHNMELHSFNKIEQLTTDAI